MSEYTPSTEEIRAHWGIAVDVHRRPERLAEFDRMIAEVERAAAEKAWDRCVGEMPIDPDWKNFYGDNNPYRKAVQS